MFVYFGLVVGLEFWIIYDGGGYVFGIGWYMWIYFGFVVLIYFY